MGENAYSVTDIRELQKRLKSIDPMLRTELVRNAKLEAQPIVQQVKSSVVSVNPLSGMTRGRLAWYGSTDAKGKTHKPDDVVAQFRTRSSGRSDTTSLVRVAVRSPAVVMADMAGKSGRFYDAGYKGTGRTRQYPYKGGTRSHKVNGQGRKMVANLGGSASRYVWPAVEQSIPAVRTAIEKVLRNAYDKINTRGL